MSATFGNTNTPTLSNSRSGGRCYAISAVPASSGTLVSITINIHTAGVSENWYFCIWADSGGVPGAMLAYSAITAVNSTGNITAAVSCALVGGTTYWIGSQAVNNNVQPVWSADASGNTLYANSPFVAGANFPASITTITGERLTVFGTYTPSGKLPPQFLHPMAV